MNRELLWKKLEAVKAQEGCCRETIDRLGGIFEQSDDWGLYRINPIHFAEKHGLDYDAVLDAMLRITRAGIFDLSWNLICPFCGGIQHSYDSLNRIEGDSFYCNICHIDFPIFLDEFIEVSFTVNPEVHRLELKTFENPDNHRRTYFSANYRSSKALQDYFSGKILSFHVFNPHSVEIAKFRAEPGTDYRMVSVVNLSDVVLKTRDKPSGDGKPVDVSVTQAGFAPREVEIDPGETILRIENPADKTMAGLFQLVDFEEMHKALLTDPPVLRPFLTGKTLLTTPVFRELFRIQDFITNLRVNVRSLTLLFTDLKGSTEMYESVGDVAAYRLVQDHFRLLGDAIRDSHGAVVKTMGDAVMATFSDPAEGLKAAIRMLDSLGDFRLEGLPQLGLKIGLHEGTALAIDNEGRLDYFGQTVNIAARVQGLASAGEIWITDTMYRSCNAPSILEGEGFVSEKQTVTLKGVGGEVTVYRCVRQAAA